MSEPALRYPVTADWSERVRAALKEHGAMARLAEHLRVPRSEVSEMLAGNRATSDLVAPIHAYLGWPPPLPPTAVLDAGEGFAAMGSLPKNERVLLETAASVLRGVHGDQAKRALMELLQLCRSY
jgi:hypothetical protein